MNTFQTFLSPAQAQAARTATCSSSVAHAAGVAAAQAARAKGALAANKRLLAGLLQ